MSNFSLYDLKKKKKIKILDCFYKDVSMFTFFFLVYKDFTVLHYFIDESQFTFLIELIHFLTSQLICNMLVIFLLFIRLCCHKIHTISVTSPESVVSEATDVQSPAADVNFSGAGQVQVTGWLLVLRQTVALFLKRLHHVRRSKKGFISEVGSSFYI